MDLMFKDLQHVEDQAFSQKYANTSRCYSSPYVAMILSPFLAFYRTNGYQSRSPKRFWTLWSANPRNLERQFLWYQWGAGAGRRLSVWRQRVSSKNYAGPISGLIYFSVPSQCYALASQVMSRRSHRCKLTTPWQPLFETTNHSKLGMIMDLQVVGSAFSQVNVVSAAVPFAWWALWARMWRAPLTKTANTPPAVRWIMFFDVNNWPYMDLLACLYNITT